MTGRVTRSLVGIELMGGEECDAIIEVVLSAHPDASVQEFPGFTRIDVPDKLVIERVEVEEFLGRRWDTRDLGQVVSAYHGYLTKWDNDVVVLSWDPDEEAGS